MRMLFVSLAALAIAVPALPLAPMHAQTTSQTATATVKVEGGKPETAAEPEEFKPEQQATKDRLRLVASRFPTTRTPARSVVHPKG